MGASIFTLYSLCVYNPEKSVEDEYITTKVIGKSADLTKRLLSWTWEHIVSPVLDNVVIPILKKIGEAVTCILSHICMPEHPIWYALGLLATAIVVVKFALPALGIVLL